VLASSRDGGNRIAIIRNPQSGSAVDTATLERALRSAGVSAEIIDAPQGSPSEEWLDRLADRYDVLAAAGGDGTVSTVAAAAVRTNTTLAVIPTGTLNHFARDAGIPTELDHAMDVLRSGHERAFDVGVVNGHIFLNNVSLGSYPQMVNQRDALEARGYSRPAAAAIAIARTWWHLRKLTAMLSIDGREIVRRSPFIVVGNGSYVLSGLSLGKREEISDGRLSLYVAPSTGRIGVLSLPFRALVRKLEEYERFETIHAERIAATLRHRRIATGIDGEVRILESPLQFSVRRAALRLLVPSPDSARGGPEPVEGPAP
jgi:diacylglycerol kinase family enzyme